MLGARTFWRFEREVGGDIWGAFDVHRMGFVKHILGSISFSFCG